MHRETKRIIFQVGLFVTTFVTTTMAGTEWVYGKSVLVGGPDNTIKFNEAYSWADFISGMEFSIPLLLILTVHEFGHYFMALFHKVKTSFPYYIPIPPYGIVPNQSIDFFVYHESEDNPGRPGEVWLRIPSVRISNTNGVNHFQRIKFLPALLVDESRFFIGWKQPVAGDVLVGIDNSNDTSDKMFINIEGNPSPTSKSIWENNTTVTGSLMIRPVFGIGIVDPTTGIEDEVKFSVYPNPSMGNFYIEGKLDKLEVFSITGRSVPFSMEQDNMKTFVQVNTTSGLYLLRCTSDGVVKTYKLVITR